jgi:hypothetical protein
LRHADAIWTSTCGLAEALRATQPPLWPDGRAGSLGVVPNGLDERLWGVSRAAVQPRPGPVRVLFMGSATHGGDWAVVAAAIARVMAAFGPGVAFDMIGVVGPVTLPYWVNRVSPSSAGMASYPGFANWITRQPAWDIGIAPLADTAFNRSKSAIKMMDYAALGLAVLASDVPAYRGSFADGEKARGASGVSGGLVANTEAAWFAALCDLIRNAPARALAADAARAAFLAHHTLAAQAVARRAAWLDLVPAASAVIASPRQRPAGLAAAGRAPARQMSTRRASG